MLKCDRCGQIKEDVKRYMDGEELKSREEEDKMRFYVEDYIGREIPGFLHFCTDCAIKTNRVRNASRTYFSLCKPPELEIYRQVLLND